MTRPPDGAVTLATRVRPKDYPTGYESPVQVPRGAEWPAAHGLLEAAR